MILEIGGFEKGKEYFNLKWEIQVRFQDCIVFVVVYLLLCRNGIRKHAQFEFIVI